VVTGGGFHLTVGVIVADIPITGYNAPGFAGLDKVGALEPDIYKGRKIWQLSTVAPGIGTGTGLGLSFKGSTPVPFSTLLLSGGNIPGVYTFKAADALVESLAPDADGITYLWCYPGGGTPLGGTPCPDFLPVLANGDKVTVTIS